MLQSEPALRDWIAEFGADLEALSLIYPVGESLGRLARIRRLNQSWLDRFAGRPLPKAGEERADYLLFQRYLERQLRLADLDEVPWAKARMLVPFAQEIFDLEESLLAMRFADPVKAAQLLNQLRKQARESEPCSSEESNEGHSSEHMHLAHKLVKESIDSLDRWYGFYRGYDPEFTWWVEAPYRALKESLQTLIATDEDAPIVGTPVGRARLLEDLSYEHIPYTPEELIAIAESQFKWCEDRMEEAAEELGCGRDWRTALEKVKGMHEKPGAQPAIVRKLALEAVDYVKERDLVTVPDLAVETLHMAMMPPDKQKINPFFLGGEKIIVSYPVAEMSHEEKLMSMRGNSTPLSRATVQHELIPGHHLQWFMEARYKPYRQLFWTPFWVEGWTLHWEMLLWDLGFPRTPEERIGMLFWRKHRCARVIFSLKFHLGQMTTGEAIEMLVEHVGFERANAEGEVRRFVSSAYSPLYQMAYLIGGLMFRSLYFELVGSGKMTAKQFHDAIMRENNIPPYMMRAILVEDDIDPNSTTDWRFADRLT